METSNESPKCKKTANEQLNYLIILGLLGIDLALWAGIIWVYSTSGKVEGSMVLAAGGIPSGLLGFVSRDQKPLSPSTATATTTQPDTTESTISLSTTDTGSK